MNIIFLEINPITHCEEAYHWINDLVQQYTIEVKDRGGKVKIVGEDWYSISGGFEHVILEITEENAFNNFKEREGKQRLSRIPVFDKKDLTKVVAYQALSIDISIYPEVLNDFEFKPREVAKDVFRLAEPDSGMGKQVVRLTHKPTGIVVLCGEERTKEDNEALALRLLKAKLYKKLLED